MQKEKGLEEGFVNAECRKEDLFQVLQSLKFQLEREILGKQKTIDRQREEVARLREDLEQSHRRVSALGLRLRGCHRNAESQRQLAQKLTRDREGLKQDLAWYQRTYEGRSLLGTIREKLRRRA